MPLWSLISYLPEHLSRQLACHSLNYYYVLVCNWLWVTSSMMLGKVIISYNCFRSPTPNTSQCCVNTRPFQAECFIGIQMNIWVIKEGDVYHRVYFSYYSLETLKSPPSKKPFCEFKNPWDYDSIHLHNLMLKNSIQKTLESWLRCVSYLLESLKDKNSFLLAEILLDYFAFYVLWMC